MAFVGAVLLAFLLCSSISVSERSDIEQLTFSVAKMLSFDALSPDILLQIVASLTLGDVVSLSMVNKSFNELSQEPSYWLTPLRVTQLYQPLPCPRLEDLSIHPTEDLKRMALHTLRLTRNWSDPFPQVVGAVRSFKSEVHNNILFCLPGNADTIVLYSVEDFTIICRDLKTGFSSAPMFLGPIYDMSSPMQEPDGFTVAALVHLQIIVLTVSTKPVVSTRIILRCELSPSYSYSGVFMTSAIAGVARSAAGGGGVEIQTFNFRDPTISTTIVTDRPRSRVLGSSVIGDTVYFIVPLPGDPQAFVYAVPQRLMAHSSPGPDTDYSLQRSHIARIPRPPDDPAGALGTRAYCVLSTEPNYGWNTISVANAYVRADDTVACALQITFWPRPDPAPRVAFNSEEEYEREKGRLMLPAQTVSIPGSLSSRTGTAWELLVISNSGLAVVLVVDPPPPVTGPDEGDNDGDDGAAGAEGDTAEEEDVPPPPPPKLMLVRYDPVLNSTSLHELQIPPLAEDDEQVNTQGICGLALDDHLGFVIVVTVHNLHYIPYA
ncbi:hypothetical protein DFH07DRAFT_250805 [Mycena maculata]|uniref:F-box domain-containing protein n=1 Tax=Mycena maculata TaxID=230809 RepID=A0AAD7HPZ7_9AGAR|nr:hypothetical protein DFH07DRAFT_250805 [Mycena maculata]